MKPVLCNSDNCAYCGACASACKQKAISFKFDCYGYASPNIDDSLCIECGLCEKVCPVNNPPQAFSEHPAVYALYSKDKSTVARSSSGGVFYEFAKWTIEHGGCVFGVISHAGKVEFACASSLAEVEPMQGSKYVQAEIGDAFVMAQQLLAQGRRVLFTGTPCQIAALRNFLRKDFSDLLITLEVICHGVPSKKIFDRCMTMLGIDASELQEVVYRDKRIWNFSTCIKGKSGHERPIFWKNDIYMKLFMRTLTYKPICYSCPFAQLPRFADMTMGDFWGISSSATFKENPYGTSVLIVNSGAGQDVWNSVKHNFTYELRNVDEAVRVNHNIVRPTPVPKQREDVLRDLFSLNKQQFVRKYNLQITLRNVAGYVLRSIKKIYAPK